LHEDGEVSLGVRSHSDFLLDAVFSATRSGGTDVHNEELVVSVGGVLPSKAEDTVFVVGVVSHGHVSEATSIDIHDLSSISFERVELAFSGKLSSFDSVESDEVAPFAICVHIVAHDLALSHIGVSVEDKLGVVRSLGDRVHVTVVDCVLADDSELGVSDPSPEDDLLLAYKSSDLRSLVKIVELDDSSLGSLISTDDNDVLLSVHDLGVDRHSFALDLESLASVDHDNIITVLNGDIFLRFE